MESERLLRALGDDRFLEALTFAVFATGFDPRIVERRWASMVAVFEGFRVERVAAFDDDEVAALLTAGGVIRNRAKIAATVRNAAVVRALVEEHGSVAAWLAALPLDVVGRRVALAARFDRVGPRVAELTLSLLAGRGEAAEGAAPAP